MHSSQPGRFWEKLVSMGLAYYPRTLEHVRRILSETVETCIHHNISWNFPSLWYFCFKFKHSREWGMYFVLNTYEWDRGIWSYRQHGLHKETLSPKQTAKQTKPPNSRKADRQKLMNTDLFSCYWRMNQTDVLLRFWHAPASRKTTRQRVLHGADRMLCMMPLTQDCAITQNWKYLRRLKPVFLSTSSDRKQIKIYLKNYWSVKNYFLKKLL